MRHSCLQSDTCLKSDTNGQVGHIPSEFGFRRIIGRITPLRCYHAGEYYGAEDERVVAVTNGYYMMEQVTRARTHLAIVLLDGPSTWAEERSHLRQAAAQGLLREL